MVAYNDGTQWYDDHRNRRSESVKSLARVDAFVLRALTTISEERAYSPLVTMVHEHMSQSMQGEPCEAITNDFVEGRYD